MFPWPNEQVTLRDADDPTKQYEVAVFLDGYKEMERRTDRWTYSQEKGTLLQLGVNVREWQGTFALHFESPHLPVTLEDLHRLHRQGHLYFWDHLDNDNALDNRAPVLVYWAGPWQQTWDTPMQETALVIFHFVEVIISEPTGYLHNRLGL